MQHGKDQGAVQSGQGRSFGEVIQSLKKMERMWRHNKAGRPPNLMDQTTRALTTEAKVNP